MRHLSNQGAAVAFAGQYRVLSKLGSGATGDVYLAESDDLDAQVAIKILDPFLAEDPKVLARFQRESAVISQLEHPNIVRLLRVAEAHQSHFLVMEYLDGESLATRLNRCGSLPWTEAVRIIQACLEALAVAHRAGVIHRDIKPENIQITSSQRVVLLDFGLALADDELARLTQTGGIAGTIAYMAPERFAGEPAQPAADLYSLGLVFYEMLSGGHPFPSEHLAGLIQSQLSATPDWAGLADTPTALVHIIRQLLEKSPRDRFATAEEVLQKLEPFHRAELGLQIEMSTVRTPRVGLDTVNPLAANPEFQTEPRNNSRRVKWAWVIATCLLMAVFGTGSFFFLAPQKTEVRKADTLSLTPVVGDSMGGLKSGLVSEATNSAPEPLVANPETEFARAEMPVKWREQIENSIGMRLVWIKPGEFLMGESSNPPHLPPQSDTMPQHLVSISQGFYMGMYEVTRGEYEAVTGITPNVEAKLKAGNNPEELARIARLPVASLTWRMARDFCIQLSRLEAEKQLGLIYRLPTEAEWEYACRAGTTTNYFWGDDEADMAEYAWSMENSGNQSHPVGELKPNPWGLYDISGNLYEWCQDFHDPNYYAHSPLMDPIGPEKSPHSPRKIMRGGAFIYKSSQGLFRSANRSHHYEHGYRNYIGLRVVAESTRPITP